MEAVWTGQKELFIVLTGDNRWLESTRHFSSTRSYLSLTSGGGSHHLLADNPETSHLPLHWLGKSPATVTFATAQENLTKTRRKAKP